ncbi:hypothetical protein GALL_339110 [mine drainage metagenome]|uniref:Uncharacterized protein n=1 Tax=mine drainage metagenome TaxID=410659 RepID=A0A1J5QLS5_9ZZZZ
MRTMVVRLWDHVERGPRTVPSQSAAAISAAISPPAIPNTEESVPPLTISFDSGKSCSRFDKPPILPSIWPRREPAHRNIAER